MSFAIQYHDFENGGYSWKNVDDLISKLAEAMGLPKPRYWNGSDEFNKKIDCDGLRVSAYANGSGSITIADDTYAKVMLERRNSLYEKRRSEFKP